jgi:hypothetical protein
MTSSENGRGSRSGARSIRLGIERGDTPRDFAAPQAPASMCRRVASVRVGRARLRAVCWFQCDWRLPITAHGLEPFGATNDLLVEQDSSAVGFPVEISARASTPKTSSPLRIFTRQTTRSPRLTSRLSRRSQAAAGRLRARICRATQRSTRRRQFSFEASRRGRTRRPRPLRALLSSPASCGQFC